MTASFAPTALAQDWALVLAQVPDEYEVTPGLLGFAVTFGVALVFILLMRSFGKHMRRSNANERHRVAAESEAQDAENAAAGEASTLEAGPPAEAR